MKLEKALTLLEAVVPSRHVDPLLTYVGMEAKEDKLSLFGSDGTLDLELVLDYPVAGEGRYLVPRAPFFQLVKGMEDPFLALEGRELKAASGALKAEIRLAEWPERPRGRIPREGESWRSREVEPAVLAELFSKVLYAVSREDYRGVFRGVQLEWREDGLRAVASDGYRLAMAWTGEGPLEKAVVLQASSVALLVRVLRSLEAERALLSVEEAGKALALEVEEEGFSLKVGVSPMEGTYPDYERVVPKEFVLEAVLEAPSLVRALKRALVLAYRDNRRVDLLFEGDKVRLFTEGEYGKGEEELPAKVTGTLPPVAFNGQYLLEALEAVEGEARLRLSGQTTPALLEDLGARYRAVVVPLRT